MTFTQKKILLTGANGYVGSHLAPMILAMGHQLTTLTRNPFLIEGASNKMTLDYNINNLEELLIDQEVVIHLAAMAHHPKVPSANGLTTLRKINVDNTLALALAAKKVGVKRFIFISSIKVMGESTNQAPFCADTPASPEDVYGYSKWEAEQGLHRVLDATETELIVIRPPLVWGGVMKGNLAALQKLISWGIPLPFSNIKNKRDLVSLTNLCDLICCVVDHPSAPGNTFLVSDDKTRNIAQIAQLIAPDAITPKFFPCPQMALQIAYRIPLFNHRLSKLFGNLEIDIAHTKRLLGWSAKSH